MASPQTLGILGGGQLGRMLQQSCIDFNINTCILDPDPNAPCHAYANKFVQGSFKDYETVLEFGNHADIITIEIEDVNIQALKELEAQGKKVFPQPHVIEVIQDKRLQKQFYKEKNLPTADFVLTESTEEIRANADFLPAFFKSGRGGYDGGGVKRLNAAEDITDDLKEGLIEKSIPFEKEISVIVARGENGDVMTFPTVELVFHPEYNLVDYLLSPAQITDEIKTKARQLAVDVAEAFGIVGILAVEMFLTKEGEILINEVAPRPHNSGHQTIHANVTSQYEQHLRSIMGWPLGNTESLYPSAMVNLIGAEGHDGLAKIEGMDDLMKIDGAHLILYGKPLTRPHRKMGHVTIVHESVDYLREKVNFIKNNIRIIT